jgi:hypothetical protein
VLAATAIEPCNGDAYGVIGSEDASCGTRSGDGKTRAYHGPRSIQELAAAEIGLGHDDGPFFGAMTPQSALIKSET